MANVEKLRSKLNDELKGQIVVPKTEERTRHNFIPTGIMDMDLKLRGGWPVGCMNVLYGAQSSAKSLIALKTIASAQSTCRRCYTQFGPKVKCACGKKDPCKALYVDAENYWTNEWANAIGIKDDDVYLGRPRDMEEAFDIVNVFIREEAVDLIILDSIAALSPKKEQESTMEEWQTALVPRVYTKFLRKWAGDLTKLRAAGRHLPASIFINQIRKKTGVVWGNPEIMPGGDAQYFFGSTIVRLYKKGIEMSKDDKDDPQPMFQKTRFVVEKSKVSPVKLEGIFEIGVNKYMDQSGVRRNPGDVDNEGVLIEYARRFAVIEEKPGKYKFDGKEFKNQDEIRTAIREDVAFRRDIFNATSKAYSEYVPSAVSVRKRKNATEEKET